jgi:hypothetical protein
MRKTLVASVALIFLLAAAGACFADLQYTEESKITGGAAVKAMKFAGVFSKDARQATQGSTSTISIKGNRMRRESSLGTAEIYDLDARKMIQIDLKHKTYSVVTFDELRAQIEEAKRKAAEQQAKAQKKSDAEQVKITPRIKITPGTNSRQLLNYTAKELKTRVDMEMEAQDPKHKGETADSWVNSDAYVAQVKGHDELKRFYARMAKELNWLPGELFGSNAQISQPMVEYRKSAANLNGMPLLSYVSVGFGPNPGTTGQAAAAQPTPEEKKGNIVTKGLGGMFGRKNKQDQQPGSSGEQAAGSLMDMTIEVKSISNNSLDASLFEVPTGFKQVQARKEIH